MKFSASHLQRYKQIAALLWKYGRSDLVKQLTSDDAFGVTEAEATASGSSSPEQLANDLEAMGPTYVKLGQVLAGRPDLLPDAYIRALARLQDNVKPFPPEDVEQIVMTELGVRLSKAFSFFDPKPIAAASLGQVHAAALRDGRPVVVKVQRPDIRKQIADDFEVLAQIAAFLSSVRTISSFISGLRPWMTTPCRACCMARSSGASASQARWYWFTEYGP